MEKDGQLGWPLLQASLQKVNKKNLTKLHPQAKTLHKWKADPFDLCSAGRPEIM